MKNHTSTNLIYFFLIPVLTFGISFQLSSNESLPQFSLETESHEWCCEPQTCFQDSPNIRFSLLFLKPSVDQSSYVITSTDNRFGGEVFPNGKRHLLSTNYKPGFRLEVLYNLCSLSNLVDLRFTYFKSHHSDSTSGDFLFDTIGFPGDGAQSPEDTTYAGTATILHHYNYYAGDATLNRVMFDFCSDNLTFLFGLHYAYISFKQRFTSTGTFINNGAPSPVNNLLIQTSTFGGIGPQIGIDYNYPLTIDCCGHFELNASARASLLYSFINADLHYTTLRTGSVGVNLHNDTLRRLNPSFNAQLGISYHTCCIGLQTILELKYEFLWYSKSVDRITGYDVAFAGDTLDVLDDLSMHGPLISLSITY